MDDNISSGKTFFQKNLIIFHTGYKNVVVNFIQGFS